MPCRLVQTNTGLRIVHLRLRCRRRSVIGVQDCGPGCIAQDSHVDVRGILAAGRLKRRRVRRQRHLRILGARGGAHVAVCKRLDDEDLTALTVEHFWLHRSVGLHDHFCGVREHGWSNLWGMAGIVRR